MKNRLFLFCFVGLFGANMLFAQESENKMRKNGRVTNYYKGTKNKASSGMYKKSKREGEWMVWYASGKIKAIEQYVNDTLDGAYISYLESGDTLISCAFMHGKLEGKFLRFMEPNALAACYQYKNGEQEGPQYTYTSGRIARYELIQNGQVAERVKYSSNGKISATEYYQDKKKTGTWIEYGRTMSDTFPRLVTQYQNDKRHGYTRRYRKGILVEEIYYAEDKYDGPRREWTDEGVMRSEIYYKNDRKDGVARYYFDGKLSSEGAFRQEQPIGQHHFYANAMMPMEKIYYYNDSVKAMATMYTGRINSEKQTFVKNKHHFEYVPDSIITFYANGKIFSRQFLLPSAKQDPKRLPYWDQSYTEYSEQGKVILTGTISSYGYSGDWNGYYLNGKKRSVTKYGDYSYQPAVFTAYYPNGKVKMTCMVSGKKVHTLPSVFDAKGIDMESNTPACNAIVREETKGRFEYNPEWFIADAEAVSVDYEIVDSEPPPPPVERKEDEVFTFVEVSPSFVGGEEAMREYMKKNMHYPQQEQEMYKQGTVYLRFTVEKNGSITDIQVVKEVPGAPGLTKEAIRLISGMPNWNPGQMNGRTVRTVLTIPIRFQLN